MEACDKCQSCVSFNENASFNIYELDGASNNSVDEIRNLVDKVRIPPQMGKYKVYIIDEVHMLSASAFNAFLKTLEEPPAYAKFILATTEKHKIIPTILSRCQIFDFKRITVEDIAIHLNYVATNEGIKAEENALHIIAQKADGAMRDALSIFDQLVSFAGHDLTYETVLENLNVLDYEYFFNITGHILEGDISSTLLTINEILDKGFDGQHFLIGFGEHIRNLLVCKDPVTVKLLETAPTIRNRYLEQSALCPVDFLLKVLEINSKCDLNYKISNNKRLHLELALMQMCIILRNAESTPDEIQKRRPSGQNVPVIEKKPSEPVHAPPLKPAESVKAKESKALPGTLSIKDMTASQLKESEKKSSVAEEKNRDYGNSEIFTLELLETAWDEFSETLHSSMPHLSATMKKHRPVLKEDFLIEFCVDNKVLAENLAQKRNELLDFLIGRLNNTKIHLQIVVPDHPIGLKPYTDREKFGRMAEKNPDLIDLREQLDLEID
jgi:DNA polymerase-3 subunit gamma/tau